MRVLVTGATGFVGRPVVQRLRQQGAEVVTLGRGSDADVRVDLLAADLAVDDALSSAGADVLVHVAWYAEHGKFWDAPVNTRWVDASVRLADSFCRIGGRRIVGVGTCAEYEWATHAHCHELSTPLRPATGYGAAKNQAHEAMAAICATNRVTFAWARLFIPIGKEEPPGRLIPSLVAVLRGKRLPFAVGGSAARDFLHVRDVASALATLAFVDAVGPYNVSSGQARPIADVVDHLALRLGADAGPLRRLYAVRPGEPLVLSGDNERISSMGWRPTLSLCDALDLILQSETS